MQPGNGPSENGPSPEGEGRPDPYRPPPSQYGQQPQYGPPSQYGQQPQYGQPSPYSPPSQYGQQPQYGQPSPYGQQPHGYPSPTSYPGGQYGAPGYQPGPAPSKKRGKLAAVVGALVVVVLVIGGAVYAVTQLGSHMLSHTAVEKAIESQSTDTSKSFRVITGVNCNGGKNVAVKRNASFTCAADGGVRITVVIQSTGTDPSWVWAVD